MTAATATADAGLVEREGELEQLQLALGAARAGDGTVIVVEAPAGHGKTELLRVLRAHAATAGMRVLSATGAQLERDFPFGLVLQLFEAEVYGAADELGGHDDVDGDLLCGGGHAEQHSRPRR